MRTGFCLVNEINLVRDLFLVYFISFIYNLYMFRTSPGPSSGGTTVFMRHLVGFEPTISAGERPQTYALDRVATRTGQYLC